VPERDWLAGEFEAHRAHLRAGAYRLLGSVAEADDAVQEAWLRLNPVRHQRGAEPGIDMLAAPDTLDHLDLTLLGR